MPHANVTSGASLVSALVLSSRPGTHYSTHVTVDPSLGSGTYYLHMIKGTATIPANGAVAFLHAPRVVVHVSGVPDEITWDDGETGVAFPVGLVLAISTTEMTLTQGSACLMIDSEVDA